MVKIYRKIKYLNYKYYERNKLLGEINNKLFFKEIKCCGYKIIVKSYINFIFYLTTFIIVVYLKNLKLSLLLCIILLLFRYVWSLYDTSKINIQNYIAGEMKHIMFSNTIKIHLENDEYEIYSHGGNYFSILKNSFQIALISTSGKVIMNELYFVTDCLSDYRDIITLFIICIDSKFYGYKIGRRGNLIYFPINTYNFYDRHRERMLWNSKNL